MSLLKEGGTYQKRGAINPDSRRSLSSIVLSFRQLAPSPGTCFPSHPWISLLGIVIDQMINPNEDQYTQTLILEAF